MTPLTRLYYQLKPYLHPSLRWTLRRLYAAQIRTRSQAVWPIKESTRHPPQGWRGWPERKQFAFVLTHDVEGRKGLRRVRQLAELEMALGFRSVFNFVPEGEYSVEPELRSWLTAHGFEVGVHDLQHDGKLYASRASFESKTRRINQYLEDWGAVGFRAGFMFRRFEWLHDLNIEYDMSAFDTDPFEPQPDGAGTIFPFWVERNQPARETSGPTREGANGNAASAPSWEQNSDGGNSPARARRGYVELPYTLPQDSTLFLLLKEKSIDIWTRKMDWIAYHGGMALLNVHPDYIDFDRQPNGRLLAADKYRDFLCYVRSTFADAFWQALPRDVARFCCAQKAAIGHS